MNKIRRHVRYLYSLSMSMMSMVMTQKKVEVPKHTNLATQYG